jgi:hypothetical protein
MPYFLLFYPSQKCGLKNLIYLVEGDPNTVDASESVKTAYVHCSWILGDILSLNISTFSCFIMTYIVPCI